MKRAARKGDYLDAIFHIMGLDRDKPDEDSLTRGEVERLFTRVSLYDATLKELEARLEVLENTGVRGDEEGAGREEA